MNLPITVTQNDLLEILINIAPVRPVFIWGAPGIGKSALVEQFAREVGLPCVSLLGSQLAPEDIIGIPQIKGETSEFLPPKMIARKEPYVLFLDELNACTQEVQKAFYSLIHERRIGEYCLPEGSIVVGAGNRAQDSAIVKTMSSALINRMFHVQLKADAGQWIKWAQAEGLHPWIIDYIIQRPDHLVFRTTENGRTIFHTTLLAYAQRCTDRIWCRKKRTIHKYLENACLCMSFRIPCRNVSCVHKNIAQYAFIR